MKKSLISLAATLAIVGCAKEAQNNSAVAQKSDVTIFANAESTKATVDNATGSYSWSANDRIGVVQESSENAACFIYVDGSNNAFSGTANANEAFVYAVFPVDVIDTDLGVDASGCFVNLGDVDGYVPGTVSPIMVAQAPVQNGDNYTFQFRHAAAVLQFTIENVPVGAQTFELSTTDVNIAGTWSITSFNNAELVAAGVEDNAKKSVSLNFAPITEAGQTLTFNVAVPIGTYTNFTIKLLNGSNTAIMTKTVSDINLAIARGDLIVTPTITLAASTDPEPETYPFSLLTSTDGLQVGMELVFVADKHTKIASHIESGNDYMLAKDVVIAADNTITINDESAVEIFSLGGSVDNWTFTNRSNQLLGSTAAKSISFTSGVNTWKISISGGISSVSSTNSAYGKLQYNASNPRFTTYASNQTGIKIFARSDAPFISVATASKELIYAANEGDIEYNALNAEGKTISATVDGSWLSASIINGKLHYSATKNSGEERTAVASISIEGGNSAAILFTQAACGDMIEVTDIADIAAVAGSTDFTVNAIFDAESTTEWTAAVQGSSDWITVSNVNGKLHVTTTANSESRRTADVELALTGNTSVKKTITITQLGTASIESTKEYIFGDYADFANWSTTYKNYTLEYDECTVALNASKQTTTIKDCPVTKGKDVKVIMKGNRTIKSITFTCEKWKNNDQTITMHYSIDGGANYTESNMTSSTFVLETNVSSYGNVNAIMYTFSSTSKQVGIQKVVITYLE